MKSFYNYLLFMWNSFMYRWSVPLFLLVAFSVRYIYNIFINFSVINYRVLFRFTILVWILKIKTCIMLIKIWQVFHKNFQLAYQSNMHVTMYLIVYGLSHFSLLRRSAHGGCNRSAEYAHSSMAPDHTFFIF